MAIVWSSLFVRRSFCFRVDAKKLDLTRCYVNFSFYTGAITSRQIATTNERDYPIVKEQGETITAGDTLTVEVIGEKHITILDSEVQPDPFGSYFLSI